MVHYKRRYITRTFHQRVILTLEVLDQCLLKRHPIIHSFFFHSKLNGVTKVFHALVRLLVGLLFGYFIHYLFIGRIQVGPDRNIDTMIRLAIVWLIAIAYTQSVHVRTIVCLILPILINGNGKLILFLLISLKILDLIITPITINIRRLFLIFICFFGFRVTERYNRFLLTYIKPLETISYNIFNPNSLHDLMYSIEEQYTFPSNMDDIVKEIEQIYNELRWPYSITVIFVPICSKRLVKLIPSFVPIKFFWKIVAKLCHQLVQFIFESSSDANPLTYREHSDKLNTMIRKVMIKHPDYLHLQEVRDNFNSQKVSIEKLSERYQSLNIFQANLILDQYKIEKSLDYFYYLAYWTVNIILIMSVFKAVNYYKRYLTSLDYDNVYINRYFHHIDERRRSGGKTIRILPLRGSDQQELIELYSPSLSMSERLMKTINNKTIIILCLIVSLLAYANLFLTQYMAIINRRLDGVYYQSVVHRFAPTLNGSTLLAPIKLFLQWMHFNHTRNYEFNLEQCSHEPSRLTNEQYLDLLINFILIFMLSITSTYIGRARSIICDYYHLQHGRKRTLTLYNYRLKRHKELIARRVETIELLIESNRVYPDNDYDQVYCVRKRKHSSRTPWAIRFLKGISNIFSSKKCFICFETIKVPYLVCDTLHCQLLYCELCWLDINCRCLNCKQEIGGKVVFR